MMDLQLNNKTALVTGESKGIGQAITLELQKEGCIVDVCSRTKGILFDVMKDDIKLLSSKYDILINNVGGGGRWGTETYEDFAEWDVVYEKNAGIARKLTMHCLPYMRSKNWGRVITIASIYGKESGGRPWFNMAKAAEISLMKNLTGKYKGVTFNTVAPGHIDVGTDVYTGEGRPEDVSGIVCFLCSDRAKYINGACITVDGGKSKSF